MKDTQRSGVIRMRVHNGSSLSLSLPLAVGEGERFARDWWVRSSDVASGDTGAFENIANESAFFFRCGRRCGEVVVVVVGSAGMALVPAGIAEVGAVAIDSKGKLNHEY
jgi:hypothetical protein